MSKVEQAYKSRV